MSLELLLLLKDIFPFHGSCRLLVLTSDLRNGSVVVLDIARLLLGLIRRLEALEEVRVVFRGRLWSLRGF